MISEKKCFLYIAQLGKQGGYFMYFSFFCDFFQKISVSEVSRDAQRSKIYSQIPENLMNMLQQFESDTMRLSILFRHSQKISKGGSPKSPPKAPPLGAILDPKKSKLFRVCPDKFFLR